MQAGMCMLAAPIFLETGTALVYWCANGGCASSPDTIPSASSQHHRAVISVSPTGPSRSARVCEVKLQPRGGRGSPSCCVPFAREEEAASGSPRVPGVQPSLLHRLETIQRSEQTTSGDGRCTFGRENQTASGLGRSGEVLSWLRGGGNRAPFVSPWCLANRNSGSRHHSQSVVV